MVPQQTSVETATNICLASTSEAGPLSSYTYEPLPSPDTIRILTLHPALDPADEVEFDFTVERRPDILTHGNESKYEAISYVWGRPSFTHRVLNRSEQPGCCLRITESVDNLLRQLRKPTKPRRIWIDTLCINQADADEKRIQVEEMGVTYRQASKVHIWLRDLTPAAAAIVFTRFYALISMSRRGEEDFWSSDDRRRAQEGLVDTEFLQALKQLLTNPWFRRRWVIQEVAFSTVAALRCGSHKLDWNVFKDGLAIVGADLLMHSGSSKDAETGHELVTVALNTIEAMRRARNNLPSLLKLLWDFHNAECSDLRDRIFALYALALDTHPRANMLNSISDTPVMVDYNRHWTSVYQDFAEAYWSRSDCLPVLLNHLSSFGTLADSFSWLPSWVPDWSQPRAVRDELSVVHHGRTVSVPVYDGTVNGWRVNGMYRGEVAYVWDCEQSPTVHQAQYDYRASFPYRLFLAMVRGGAADRNTVHRLGDEWCSAFHALMQFVFVAGAGGLGPSAPTARSSVATLVSELARGFQDMRFCPVFQPYIAPDSDGRISNQELAVGRLSFYISGGRVWSAGGQTHSGSSEDRANERQRAQEKADTILQKHRVFITRSPYTGRIRFWIGPSDVREGDMVVGLYDTTDAGRTVCFVFRPAHRHEDAVRSASDSDSADTKVQLDPETDTANATIVRFVGCCWSWCAEFDFRRHERRTFVEMTIV